MKILIDARFYGLEHAGLGRYTINLIHEIAKIDRQNDYIILFRKKYFTEVRLPDNFKKVKVEAKHYWFKEQALVPLVIRKHKPDVVHFLHSNVPVFYSGKFIVTIHDLTMYRQGIDATTLPVPLYYAKRIPFKLVFRKAVYDSKEIIVPSIAVRDDLVNSFKVAEDKIKVIYEGVQDKQEQKTKNQAALTKNGLHAKSYFLYVGNVYPHKNIRRTIEAIVSLQNQDIVFVIVCGRGVFRNRLEKLIKNTNSEKYIKILDFVEDNELYTLYKNSLAFIFPSLSEGFGLPGLEAIQSETLVLASDIPVFKEIYKDKALFFDPYDVQSIKKTLLKVLDMPQEERQKRGVDAKKILKYYSWKKMARETLDVYKSSFNDKNLST